MKRIKDVRSVFGNVLRTSYEYMELLNKEYNLKQDVLIVDYSNFPKDQYFRTGEMVS